jgi:c-di-GMP-binding flagellar brake protein YcgR
MRNDMEERRRHARVAIDLPVVLRHGGRIIPATALNLSCGGMYLQVDRSNVAGDQPIEVIFDLNEEARDVAMRGTITRIETTEEGARIGVRFTNLFSLNHKAIQQYVHQHLN